MVGLLQEGSLVRESGWIKNKLEIANQRPRQQDWEGSRGGGQNLPHSHTLSQRSKEAP